jgi:hypothetical protein
VSLTETWLPCFADRRDCNVVITSEAWLEIRTEVRWRTYFEIMKMAIVKIVPD